MGMKRRDERETRGMTLRAMCLHADPPCAGASHSSSTQERGAHRRHVAVVRSATTADDVSATATAALSRA